MKNYNRNQVIILIVLAVLLVGVIVWMFFSNQSGTSLTESLSYFTKKKTPTPTVTPVPTQPAFASPDQASKPVPAAFTNNKIYYYPGTITLALDPDASNSIVQIATRDDLATIIKTYKSEFAKGGWKIGEQKEISGQNKIVFTSGTSEVNVVASSLEGVVNIIQYLKLK